MIKTLDKCIRKWCVEHFSQIHILKDFRRWTISNKSISHTQIHSCFSSNGITEISIRVSALSGSSRRLTVNPFPQAVDKCRL